jgi:hypothetical protein
LWWNQILNSGFGLGHCKGQRAKGKGQRAKDAFIGTIKEDALLSEK